MYANHSETIFGYLREGRLVSAERLTAIRAETATTSVPLAEALIKDGAVTRLELLASLAAHLGYEYVEDFPAALSETVLGALPGELARRYDVFPWSADAKSIELLVNDPFGVEALDELEFLLGRSVRFLLADPDRVTALIQTYYPDNAIDTNAPTSPVAEEEQSLSVQALAAMAEQAPIIQLVNRVLSHAVRQHASDVHLEPFEHELKIRYRVDGVLHEMSPSPKALALPMTSRLKVMANLDIAERRLPQDGRLAHVEGERTVDLRISTLPTQFGESVVLRVLDQKNTRLELEQLGLPADVLSGLREVVQRPNGILLVTGPTGSGKTTTLYSALRTINTADRKLQTAEDPVEYEIEGVTQVSINPAAGLTFGSAMRAFLRQDPDAIMVGEIRDTETAQVAIQASLTGHLVLSTLHTNDAASAVTRLIDLGIEPFLISASLEGVLAQRLVRRLCPHCRKVDPNSRPALATLGATKNTGDSDRVSYLAVGCKECDGSGYLGRLGLFEWLPITETIRGLITGKASTAEIREKAVADGMRTLREDGLRAVFAGETTIEEVARYT